MALDQVANGLNNIVRVFEFSDGSRCVARVHIRRNTSSPVVSKNGLSNEIATMQFIKEHSKLPVPDFLLMQWMRTIQWAPHLY
jgi:hypothetical protein